MRLDLSGGGEVGSWVCLYLNEAEKVPGVFKLQRKASVGCVQSKFEAEKMSECLDCVQI